MKVLRIDMNNCTAISETIPKKYSMLGGRGLTSQIIKDEVDPTCNPLRRNNILVIAPGLFTGTTVPSSGRLSIGAKSPLTGGIKESNAGGTVSRKLSKLGIRAIIIGEKPNDQSWYILKINKDKIDFISAEDIVGLGNYEVVSKLRKIHGDKVGIMSIGPCGEMLMNVANVMVTDQEGRPSRCCGRGGLGAVLGSKGIKAIVVDDSSSNEKNLHIKNEDKFNEIARNWAKTLIETKVGLAKFGTAGTMTLMNSVYGLPTRNFSEGCFEGAGKIDGRALAETIKLRGGKTGHACSPGCVMRCSNVYLDDKGNYVTAGLEYETLALMGSNLGIDSLDTLAVFDRYCDDYGIDTMEIGNAIGVAMQAGVARFGDGCATKKLLDELAAGTLMGKVLGQGAVITGKVLGIDHVAAVKGQGMAAYDPRAAKGTGVTYATSPMGADHTAGNIIPGRYGVDSYLRDGQIKVSRDVQIMSAVCDNMGICIFAGTDYPQMDLISQLLTTATGEKFSTEDVLKIGKDTLNNELIFNRQAGFTKVHDRIPDFFKYEKLSPKELLFDVSDNELDDTFDCCDNISCGA